VPGSDRDTNKGAPQGQIGEMVQLVKDYAKQETLGPLRGAGRWIGFGIVWAALLVLTIDSVLSIGTCRRRADAAGSTRLSEPAVRPDQDSLSQRG